MHDLTPGFNILDNDEMRREKFYFGDLVRLIFAVVHGYRIKLFHDLCSYDLCRSLPQLTETFYQELIRSYEKNSTGIFSDTYFRWEICTQSYHLMQLPCLISN